PEAFPDGIHVVTRRNLDRVVDQFQSLKTVVGNDGGCAEAGIDDLVTSDGALDEHVEATLLHRSAEHESSAAVDPDDVDLAETCFEFVRRAKIAPQIELDRAEAQAEQLVRLLLQPVRSYFRPVVECVDDNRGAPA